MSGLACFLVILFLVIGIVLIIWAIVKLVDSDYEEEYFFFSSLGFLIISICIAILTLYAHMGYKYHIKEFSHVTKDIIITYDKNEDITYIEWVDEDGNKIVYRKNESNNEQ